MLLEKRQKHTQNKSIYIPAVGILEIVHIALHFAKKTNIDIKNLNKVICDQLKKNTSGNAYIHL